MDLVDWSDDVFDGVVADVSVYVARLGVDDLQRSRCRRCTATTSSQVGRGALVDGPTLSSTSSTWRSRRSTRVARAPASRCSSSSGRRHDGRPARRYAGLVTGAPIELRVTRCLLAGGSRRPSRRSRRRDGPLEVGVPGSARVTLRLADDIDATRGDVIAVAGDSPRAVREVERTRSVCWSSRPDRVGPLCRSSRALAPNASSSRPARPARPRPRSGPSRPAHLDANDIGIVRFATAGPLVVDADVSNRFTAASSMKSDDLGGAGPRGLAGRLAPAPAPCEEAVHRRFRRPPKPRCGGSASLFFTAPSSSRARRSSSASRRIARLDRRRGSRTSCRTDP